MVLYDIYIITSTLNIYIYIVLSVHSWRGLTHLYYQRTEKRTDRGLNGTAFHVKNPRNNHQRVSSLAVYSYRNWSRAKQHCLPHLTKDFVTLRPLYGKWCWMFRILRSKYMSQAFLQTDLRAGIMLQCCSI